MSNFQRDVIIDEIYDFAEKNRDVFFMSADFGAPSLDKFRLNLPNQFIHSGISEQHMIDMAAGLALDGNKVYVYAMAPFITLRCLEQIKCSLAMMNLPVTILGVGLGLGYADAGPTHYLNEDIAIMNSIVNLNISSPSDVNSTKFIAQQTIENPKLRYIRMEKNNLHDIYPLSYNFDKEGYEKINNIDTNDICILSYGYMTHKAIEAQKKLSSENIEVSIYDIINIKPLSDSLIREISKYKKIITVEEQTLNGGFGSIIINALMRNGISNKNIKCLGLDDKYYFQNGGREFLLDQSGLSADSIYKTVKNL
jgi:transketolase